jgi:hypothetical protein
MTAQNSTATNAVHLVSAGEPTVRNIDGVNYNRTNNNVSDGGGNTNWDFTVPEIVDARTIYDNVIRIEFSEPVRNAANEAWSAVTTAVAAGAVGLNDEPGQVWVNELGDAVLGSGPTVGLVLDGAWVDAALSVSLNGAVATNVIYLEATGGTWNTDADGGHAGALTTGLGAGDTVAPGISTNSQDLTQSIDVSLHLIKGLFTDAESINAVQGYGGDTEAGGTDHAAGYVNTRDFAKPVLVGVEAGRRFHEDNAAGSTTADYTAFDGHNYFLIRYSEKVDLDGAANDTILNDPEDGGDPSRDTGAIGDGDAIRRADTTVAAGDIGGYVNGSGTVNVTGFFQYPGTLTGGSTDGNVATSAVARKATDDDGAVLNTYGDHGAVVVVKGWSSDAPGLRTWPGYIDYMAPADRPSGKAVTVPSQAVRLPSEDMWGNPVLDVDDMRWATVIHPTIIDIVHPWWTGWDDEAPDFAQFKPYGNPSDFREIVTMSKVGNPQGVDQVEIHFHDNPETKDVGWDSVTGVPPDGHPDNAVNNPQAGIRDHTVENAFAGGAFFLDFEGVAPPALQALPASTVFTTEVDNDFFTLTSGTASYIDDNYVGFSYNEADRPFSTVDRLWMYYSAPGAATGAANIVTDLAGNRLPQFTQYVAIERLPPNFAAALAIADTTRVYIRFSERVLGAGGVDISPLDPNTIFEIFDATTGLAVPGLSITSMTPLQTRETAVPGTFATLDIFLTLNTPVTPAGALDWRIRPFAAGTLEDEFTAAIAVTEVNRITDVALGVIQPVAAWNEIQRGDLYGDEFDGLLDATEFDGSGELLAGRDTRLQAGILDAANAGLPVELYFDVDPDPSVLTDTDRPETPNEYWLPVGSGIVDDPETGDTETLPPNLEARRVLPAEVNGQNIEFRIDGDDEELDPGAEVEIILSIDGLPAARYTDPTDPRTVAPWVINLRRFIEQRGGVTILNNVIYPADGDITVLDYDLQSAGFVTIHVFTLDGTRVKTLVRTRQTAGRYQTSWDGTNASGQTVASGLYFIRVVGPGIDEIRKVLVAR